MLSSQYFYKAFVCGFVVFVLFFVVAELSICFVFFVTYSTSYCSITNLWIHGMYVNVYILVYFCSTWCIMVTRLHDSAVFSPTDVL